MLLLKYQVLSCDLSEKDVCSPCQPAQVFSLEEEAFPHWWHPETLLTDSGKPLMGRCVTGCTYSTTTASYHPRVNPTE